MRKLLKWSSVENSPLVVKVSKVYYATFTAFVSEWNVPGKAPEYTTYSVNSGAVYSIIPFGEPPPISKQTGRVLCSLLTNSRCISVVATNVHRTTEWELHLYRITNCLLILSWHFILKLQSLSDNICNYLVFSVDSKTKTLAAIILRLDLFKF